MNFTINIDHDKKIIRYQHSGNIDKEDIGKAWELLLSKKEFSELGYNLLSDYRNSSFNIDIEDVDEIISFLLKLKHILKGKKQSLIYNNPISIAMSILFEEEANKKIGFKVKVFSTEEAALNWLVE